MPCKLRAASSMVSVIGRGAQPNTCLALRLVAFSEFVQPPANNRIEQCCDPPDEVGHGVDGLVMHGAKRTDLLQTLANCPEARP